MTELASVCSDDEAMGVDDVFEEQEEVRRAAVFESCVLKMRLWSDWLSVMCSPRSKRTEMGTRVVMSTWMRGQGVSTSCWACAFGVRCRGHPEGAVLPAGPHSEVRTDQQPQQSGPDKPKVTTRFMTKYERARILGTRALQIRSAFSRL